MPVTSIVDTHSHALPLVDHGSPDVETTLRMIGFAVEQGVTAMCLTPHLYDYDAALIARSREVFRQVAAAVAEAGMEVRLYPGFEVSMLLAATADAEQLRSVCIDISGDGEDPAGGSASGGGEAATGTRCARPLLIEMPFSNWPPMFEQTIARLASSGFLPVIAHPERNDRVRRSVDVLEPCLGAGAILQGTAGSFSEIFRRDSQKPFHEILARGWYGLLASDAHSQPSFTWTVGPLLEELGKRVTPEDRELLVSVNPARLLKGQRPLPMGAGSQPAKSRRFFS